MLSSSSLAGADGFARFLHGLGSGSSSDEFMDDSSSAPHFRLVPGPLFLLRCVIIFPFFGAGGLGVFFGTAFVRALGFVALPFAMTCEC